jgi:hypothetical protein
MEGGIELETKEDLMSFYIYFGQSVIFQSKQAASGIPIECLDSTLVVSFVYDNNVYNLMYGDGYIIYNHKVDGLRMVYPEFKGNAPFYLSYLANIHSMKHYENFAARYEGSRTLTKHRVNFVNDSHTEETLLFDHRIICKEAISNLSLLMITSDGLASFTNERNEPADIKQLVLDLTSIKRKSGEFIQGRVSKVLPALAENKILNYDDFSVGAFLFLEEE